MGSVKMAELIRIKATSYLVYTILMKGH